ncbi:MAG TPA: protein kinase, partial [Longimicrobiales bacterium]|nr:protein kinase [Longimicrobiales bacterium]
RFLAEIRTTARLQHPHIVPLFDSGEAGGFLYYVMPCIEGESLRARLDREKRLDVEAMLAVARPVAQALAYAHEMGVVHRDIKPENILLSRSQPFVTDFGIARAVSVAGGARLTSTGEALGTPTYMSPEQVTGEAEVDARSDIYSLGCVIYEMLSGTPPFTGRTIQALLARRLTGPPPHLSNVPPPVDEVVRRSLATAPQDRFASAIALADALVEAAHRPATPELSLVVLPFENLSPDPDNAFFADGLTEELIADLSRVRALRVISRTSAMHFKGTTKQLPEIARELNVRYVLEGSVRRAGNSLRITAQLIEAGTDAHLWAEKYNGTLEDVFDLQEQLSRRIVEALKIVLTSDEARRLSAHATRDPREYEVWLRGRQEAFRMTREGIESAVRINEQGMKAFGETALLCAADGVFHYFLYDYGFSHTEETLARVEASSSRALELNPELALAWFSKGLARYKRGDFGELVRHLRRSIDLERNSDALSFLAFVLAEVGWPAEARGYADEALERDPLQWGPAFGRSVVDLFDGRFDPAVARFREWIARETPDLAFSLCWLGTALAYAGNEDEARATFERGSGMNAPLFPEMCELGARAFRGDLEGTRRLFATSESLQAAAVSDGTFPQYLATCFARAGDSDAALRWLDQAITWGFSNHRFLAEHNRFYAPLRGDPRFEALMDKAREKQRAIEVLR